MERIGVGPGGEVVAAGGSPPAADMGPAPQAVTAGARIALEDVVPDAVAAVLRARDDEQLLAPLVALVAACGGRVADGADPIARLRSLPDELVVPDGRELTLGPVLRALSAAALERASGDLAPPRGSRPPGPRRTGARECLVTFDLGDLGAVRSELGDAGARWLVDKLRRTLRSLLRPDDRAMRYPAGRFLVLLSHTGPAHARQFARRLSWEWDSYLGRDLRVTTRVTEVHDGDLAASLRRITSAGASAS
jgi:GGDEF domain-containing protein